MSYASRAAALLLIASCALAAGGEGGRLPELYIAAGQSNMVGLGGRAEPRHLAAHPRIAFCLLSLWGAGDLTWQPTKGTIPEDLGKRGIGPWWAFAQVMAEAKPTSEIRVLQVAVSGSALKEWIAGGKHFERYVPIARAAIADGLELKGMIWHQGEAGTGLKHGEGPGYEEMFARMVSDWRTALDAPDMPVVAGSLGKKGVGGAVNAAMEKHAGRLPNFAFAVTRDRTLADNVHYDAPSCEALGVEMAHQMLGLEGVPVPGKLPLVLTRQPQPDWIPPAGAYVILAGGDATTTRSPTVNLGDVPRLYVCSNEHFPNLAFLRFQGIPEGIHRVSLVLHARAIPKADAVLHVFRAAADFDERTLTASNAPTPEGEPVKVDVKQGDGAIAVDVSALLRTGDRTLTVVLSAYPTTDPLVFDSREGAWPPRLVVESEER